MKSILILRHGKSSWKHAGLADHDRPLKKRGRRDARRMGRLLVRERLVPDLILTSTAVRARGTAERLVEACACRGEVRLVAEFYGAGPDLYLDTLAALDAEHERVMVVGHNPGLEELLDALTGRDEPLPTAALAHVQLGAERWPQLRGAIPGYLAGLWYPRELDDR